VNAELSVIKRGAVFHLCRFAKLLGYSRASNHEFRQIIRYFEKLGFVAVQQSGFMGHSMYHPKLVAILKPLEIVAFKHAVLLRTNYAIGEFAVHKTQEKRKCEQCKHIIDIGERYGVKVRLGRLRQGKKRIVFSQTILCLYCLLEQAGIEGLEA
jgi:hypothetical protein